MNDDMKPAPAPPFAKGSWQHAVDDALVGYQRTSQEFATPHEAVAWLLKTTANAAIACAAPAPKDHEIRELVNRLRDIAIEFHGAQQLRERIAQEVVPFVKRAAAPDAGRALFPQVGFAQAVPAGILQEASFGRGQVMWLKKPADGSYLYAAPAPQEPTDEMALAFHRATSDGDIGQSEVDDIKTGLRAALAASPAAPQPEAPALSDEDERKAFESWAEPAQNNNRMTPYERLWALAAWQARAALSRAGGSHE